MEIGVGKKQAVIAFKNKDEVDTFAEIIDLYMETLFEDENDKRDEMTQKLDKEFNPQSYTRGAKR